MKAMYAGLAATVVITIAAWYGLSEMGVFTSAAQQSGDAVRLD